MNPNKDRMRGVSFHGSSFVKPDRMPVNLQNSMNRTSHFLKLVLRVFALFFFAYILTLLNTDTLPDYESYSMMFEYASTLTGRYSGFSGVAGSLKALGLNYDLFRTLVLILGILLTAMLLRFKPDDFGAHAALGKKKKKRSILFLILFFTVVLEFYLVRLRGGISIFFFLLGFLKILEGHEFRVKYSVRSTLILLMFFLSAIMHTEIFLSLSAFLMPPLAFSRFAKGHKYNQYKSLTFFFLLCALIWYIVFWQGVAQSTETRGAHLNSPLNPVRFFSISIIPIMIWFPVWVYYRNRYSRAARATDFPYLFGISYIASAVSLLFFYSSGAGAGVGEAIVRVVTLSSVGAGIAISGWGVNMSNSLPVYLLASNSLFFINTIYF